MMQGIKEICCCGSSIEHADGSWGGNNRHDKWIERHKDCLEKYHSRADYEAMIKEDASEFICNHCGFSGRVAEANSHRCHNEGQEAKESNKCQCDYCNGELDDAIQAQAHELKCKYNPINKECVSCSKYGRADSQGQWHAGKIPKCCAVRIYSANKDKPCDEWEARE